MSAGQLGGRHGDVHALGRADRGGVGALVEGPHLVGPDPGGVDHHPCPDVEVRAVGRLAEGPGHGRPDPRTTRAPMTVPRSSVTKPDHRRVVGGHRAVVQDGGAQHGQGEPGVVGPGVEVQEAGHQPVGAQGGQVGQGLGLGHPAVPGPDAEPAGQVVEPQRRTSTTGPRPWRPRRRARTGGSRRAAARPGGGRCPGAAGVRPGSRRPAGTRAAGGSGCRRGPSWRTSTRCPRRSRPSRPGRSAGPGWPRPGPPRRR